MNIEAFKTTDNKAFVFEGESMNLFPIEDSIKSELSFDDNHRTTSVISTDLGESISESISTLSKGILIPAPTPKDRELKSIVIPITKACNLACPYCFANANKKMDFTQDFTEEDEENLIAAISTCTEEASKINIIFFGGEPLIRFNIIERMTLNLKRTFPKKEIGFSITTNGTLINEKRARFLAENNFAVLLSVDGFENSHNHRRYKNGRHTFSRVMKNFELLKECGVYVEFRATLTSDNPYMADTFKFFENLKRPFTIAFAYESANVESADFINFDKSHLQSIERAYQDLEEFYLEKINNNEPIYDSVLSDMLGKIDKRIHQECVCAGGFTYFTLLHKGKLYACPHLMENEQYVLGNINDFERLKSIDFNHTPVPVKFIDKCNSCWAKHLCMGGCTTQKINGGRNSGDSLSPERCELEKLMLGHYLRLYYHLKTKNTHQN